MNHLLISESTLWDRWQRNADRVPERDAIIHWIAGEEPFRWTFGTLIQAADDFAELLLDRNVKRGDVCALVVRHNKLFYPLYLACVSIGAIPSVLAYPNSRLHPDKFRQGFIGMAGRSGLDWILTERELEPVLRPLMQSGSASIRGLGFPLEWEARSSSPKSNGTREGIRTGLTERDPLLLQHSSGTTGLQKAVVLSHRAVLSHLANYGSALRLSEDDKIASWLPLYHDMGLIAAFHVPLAFGIPSVQIDPFEWVVVPGVLLEAVSKERATISWMPNFAFSMMADKVREDDLEGLTLDSWRLIVSCSEPVRFEDQQKFLKRLAPYGLKGSALSACYAMAETTFAVTQTAPGEPPATMALDKAALAKGKAKAASSPADARMCVSSGRLIPGCDIRIVDPLSGELGDGAVGEIAISSASMFDEYRNYPSKTAEVLRDGWYYSGDYGFRCDGEYYVIGRKKDIIIVAGHNIYPEDVEAAVGAVDGVLPGRVVAFGEEDEAFGSERVSVIAETAITGEGEHRALRKAVIAAGMAIDVSITNVYLVPPRTLIKSSAGKPSRQANKDQVQRLKTADACVANGRR